MPLVESPYYTLDEALDAIKKVLPDEDPMENLCLIAHQQLVAIFILNHDGKYIAVPHELWRAGALGSDHSLTVGLARHGSSTSLSTNTSRAKCKLTART